MNALDLDFEELEWIKRAQSGDSLSFDRLVQRHDRRVDDVDRVVAELVGSRREEIVAQSEDLELVQELDRRVRRRTDCRGL